MPKRINFVIPDDVSAKLEDLRKLTGLNTTSTLILLVSERHKREFPQPAKRVYEGAADPHGRRAKKEAAFKARAAKPWIAYGQERSHVHEGTLFAVHTDLEGNFCWGRIFNRPDPFFPTHALDSSMREWTGPARTFQQFLDWKVENPPDPYNQNHRFVGHPSEVPGNEHLMAIEDVLDGVVDYRALVDDRDPEFATLQKELGAELARFEDGEG